MTPGGTSGLGSHPQSLGLPACHSVHSFPLLSHHFNLNKSSPSWPHPPASVFLPRGPEAPTTQAVWEGGGPVLLPKGGLHTVNTCTVQMLPTLSHTRSSTAHTHTSSYSGVRPALIQARTMCMPTQDPRTHGPLSAHRTCTLHRRMLGYFTVCSSERPLCITVTHVNHPIPQHRTYPEHVYTNSQSPSAHVSVNKHRGALSLTC